MATLPFVSRPSSSAIPSLESISGLFDTGFTGAGDTDNLSPVNTDTTFDLDLSTLETDQLFDMLGDAGLDCSDLKDLNTPEIGKETLDLEVFTDLSDYTKTMAETRDVPVLDVKVRKRKVDTSPVNTDHDGYISKKPKLATNSVKMPKTNSRAILDSVPRASVSSVDADTTDTESGSKDLKYLERRRKNNIASHRSRENRKAKYANMESEAVKLAKANLELQARVEELERVTKLMKDTLVKRLAQGN